MGYAALTHPTVRPLSERPIDSVNDRDERKTAGRLVGMARTTPRTSDCQDNSRWVRGINGLSVRGRAFESGPGSA
jgi:hypothetical protein